MPAPLVLSKEDARRALVRHNFARSATQMDAFERLRSVQFDPIAPVGCNHDLVLQARVPGYKVGDWAKTAYEDRLIYDGWDKQASLVPFEGWPLRRYIHKVYRKSYDKKIFIDHKDAVDRILRELADKGPMMPKDFDFQQRSEDLKVSWHGPSVTKHALRALWGSGLVMTSGRKNGQHLYDLAERVVPSKFLNQPMLQDFDAQCELALERHRAMGLVRPASQPEIWSYTVLYYDKKEILAELAARGSIVPVEIEGMKVNAMPEFVAGLDQPPLEPRVVFVAPLDPFMWDRKMVAHLFGFDYIWEIYTPEAKRKWGYYVLPVLYGDELVAKAEFFCRDGNLELREWHFEKGDPGTAFWGELEKAMKEFMSYCSAKKVTAAKKIDPKVKDFLKSAGK